MKLNSIGLSVEKSGELSNELNSLLANFQTYYQILSSISILKINNSVD